MSRKGVFLNSCRLAAGILLLAGTFSLAQSTKEESPVIAEVLGRKIRMSEKNQMKGLICRALLDEYAKANKIEPTQAEVDESIKHFRRADEKRKAKWVKGRDEVEQKLKSTQLTEAERKELDSQLKMYCDCIKSEAEMEEELRKDPEGSRKAEEEVARQVVRMWKLNQALFRQYGGRVIFQQAGMEPLDAYRDFLREQEKKGAFKILDQTLVADFWKYFVDEKMHRFVPKEEGAKYMEKPWWLMEKPAEKASKDQ